MSAIFQTPASLTDTSLSAPLFKTPLARQKAFYAKPYQSFATNFHLGFGDEDTRISVQQSRKTDLFASPPDHAFVLELAVEAVAGTKWISLEGKIDPGALTPTGRLSVLASMKASARAPVHVTLRVFRADGSFADLGLGGLRPGNGAGYIADTVSERLSPLSETLRGGVESAYVLLFFPVEAGLTCSLAMLNLFVTEEPVL